MRDAGDIEQQHDGDVVLGDDWVAPDSTSTGELSEERARRGYFSLKTSPLTRKIITVNLVVQRAIALVSETELIADAFEAQLPNGSPANLAAGDGVDVEGTLANLSLRNGLEVFIFDTSQNLVGQITGTNQSATLTALTSEKAGNTIILDGLNAIWSSASSLFSPSKPEQNIPTLEQQLRSIVPEIVSGGTKVDTGQNIVSGAVFSAASPIMHQGVAIGVVALATPAGEIDALVRGENERVLQMFVVAILVSIGLSLVLASTIANPLADLAEAAELGRDRNTRRVNPGRIRIPDLSARPDEIGRLSRALRGMVAALYNRIDGNEQFAADVAHEIKNPLASLRSAVSTLRMIKRDDQRVQLLDVIEHDVRRLDRLVSDISNASRLDSELVKEDESEFDLLTMLGNLNQYLGEDARSKGIDYITDLPTNSILVHGLEARLAQVFVNLITNAISFCEGGDAIRVWARRRDNRVLVVIEDTGPGIPEEALNKIFQRFYSQRPDDHFGNNSGLGLAISKQIVEAHGGVIWAENIRPTEADITSEPLGARFVVGLPV